MALAFDDEYRTAISAILSDASPPRTLPRGDIEGRRTSLRQLADAVWACLPTQADVKQTDHSFQSYDGQQIMIREYRSGAADLHGKAIYYIHGGGMFMGSVDLFNKATATWAKTLGIPVFAVDYRLAPENPHPTPINDCYHGLLWLHQQASLMRFDPGKIIVWGESAGGGLAAGTALMCRDQAFAPPILKLVLIYPMLDDRNNRAIPGLNDLARWKVDDNITGWQALLGSAAGGANVSEYAAPARAQELTGLPPTYIECGQLDIFVDEDVQFAARLLKAQVPVELHIYPGMPHGFMMIAPHARYSQMATSNVSNAILHA